jgi:hypothetical protein
MMTTEMPAVRATTIAKMTADEAKIDLVHLALVLARVEWGGMAGVCSECGGARSEGHRERGGGWWCGVDLWLKKVGFATAEERDRLRGASILDVS